MCACVRVCVYVSVLLRQSSVTRMRVCVRAFARVCVCLCVCVPGQSGRAWWRRGQRVRAGHFVRQRFSAAKRSRSQVGRRSGGRVSAFVRDRPVTRLDVYARARVCRQILAAAATGTAFSEAAGAHSQKVWRRSGGLWHTEHLEICFAFSQTFASHFATYVAPFSLTI